MPTVYTLGHSTHTLEHFERLLRGHAIEVVGDVRSIPHSQWKPEFSQSPLRAVLRRRGFDYVYLGDQLGGIPADASFYNAAGKVVYARLAASGPFERGMERLQRGIETYCVALMCAEEDPAHCHRHRLLARVLTARGVEVRHVRGNGQLQVLPASHDGVPPGMVRTLFGLEEDRDWVSG